MSAATWPRAVCAFLAFAVLVALTSACRRDASDPDGKPARVSANAAANSSAELAPPLTLGSSASGVYRLTERRGQTHVLALFLPQGAVASSGARVTELDELVATLQDEGFEGLVITGDELSSIPIPPQPTPARLHLLSDRDGRAAHAYKASRTEPTIVVISRAGGIVSRAPLGNGASLPGADAIRALVATP